MDSAQESVRTAAPELRVLQLSHGEEAPLRLVSSGVSHQAKVFLLYGFLY